MEPTLTCPNCGWTGFESITNEFTELKGRANRGMVEMETTGECGKCGTEAYSSIITELSDIKLVTKGR